MHKIDHPTATPGGLFTIGDPVGAVPATVVTDDWLNAVQTEFVNVIEGAGGALDKSDNAQLLAAIQTLIANAGISWDTGDVKLTMQPTPVPGWIVCNDGTIGKTGSAATARANDDTAALYALLWNSVSDAYAPVSSGRGVSAANDFAAGKTIALTKMMGRALAVAGNGSGLSSRPLGSVVGAETHTLTVNEMPSHSHLFDKIQSGIAGLAGSSQFWYNGINDVPTSSTGGDAAHNNMQPTAFLYAHIKL